MRGGRFGIVVICGDADRAAAAILGIAGACDLRKPLIASARAIPLVVKRGNWAIRELTIPVGREDVAAVSVFARAGDGEPLLEAVAATDLDAVVTTSEFTALGERALQARSADAPMVMVCARDLHALVAALAEAVAELGRRRSSLVDFAVRRRDEAARRENDELFGPLTAAMIRRRPASIGKVAYARAHRACVEGRMERHEDYAASLSEAWRIHHAVVSFEELAMDSGLAIALQDISRSDLDRASRFYEEVGAKARLAIVRALTAPVSSPDEIAALDARMDVEFDVPAALDAWISTHAEALGLPAWPEELARGA